MTKIFLMGLVSIFFTGLITGCGSQTKELTQEEMLAKEQAAEQAVKKMQEVAEKEETNEGTDEEEKSKVVEKEIPKVEGYLNIASLKEGTMLTYENQGGKQSQIKIQYVRDGFVQYKIISNDESVRDNVGSWYEDEVGLYDASHGFGVDKGDEKDYLHMLGPKGGSMLVHYPISVGSKWEYVNGYYNEVTAFPLTIETKAGTFHNVIEVLRTENRYNGDVVVKGKTYFAPGVGKVKTITINDGKEFVSELVAIEG